MLHVQDSKFGYFFSRTITVRNSWNNVRLGHDLKAEVTASHRDRDATLQKNVREVFLALRQKWRWTIYQKVRSMSKTGEVKKVLTKPHSISFKSVVKWQTDVAICNLPKIDGALCI